VTAPAQPAEHAHKPNNQAGEHAASPAATGSNWQDDLRDQLAEALYQWTLSEAAPGGSRPPYLDPRTEQRLRENSAARADVCAAVVQPALDAKDAEIRDLLTSLGQQCLLTRAYQAEVTTLRAVHQQIGDL
jgi:hypothetical protein